MGGRHSSAMTGPFFLMYVARNAPPIVATVCTKPNGMLNRMVVKGSSTKDCTIKGPKVEMPPEGMLMEKSSANQHHVFRSSRASFAWSHRHSRDITPIWFMRSRSIAMSLLCSSIYLASTVESCMKMYMTKEKATVKTPKKKKMIWTGVNSIYH